MKKLIEELKRLKLYFLGFLLITILYTLFYFIIIYTSFFSTILIRVDFIGYTFMGIIIFLFGFLFGYKEKNGDIDAGLFFGLLFFISAMQMAVYVFDNIVIIMRVFGPEQLDLDSPMEIQFIYIYFLTINQYRFFTLIYLFSGMISLLYIRKRSTMILGTYFMVSIYSSLILGYIFNLPISVPYITDQHLNFYILCNIFIGAIFFCIFLIIRYRFEKSFKLRIDS